MFDFILSWVFGGLDPIITFPAALTTQLLDYWTYTAEEAKQDTTFVECSLRIDRSTQSTLMLPDSRVVSYSQFGSAKPTAKTIFYLHGFPGAAVEGALLDRAAQNLNVRVIGVDRPGTGKSTPDPTRTILAHAKDVEMVAEHLSVEHYGVLGVSGGGPYALACAKSHSADKLRVVGIVCGLGPSDIGYKGMFMMNYLGWTLSSHYTPRFLKWWFSREPAARLDLPPSERMKLLTRNYEAGKSKMNPKDKPFLGDKNIMKLQLRCGEDAYANGLDCMYQDMNLLASDPGFRVEDIRKDLNVCLWYGKEDGNVPLNHGKEISRRLQSGDSDSGERLNLTIKDQDTHISIFHDHREAILAEMIKKM